MAKSEDKRLDEGFIDELHVGEAEFTFPPGFDPLVEAFMLTKGLSHKIYWNGKSKQVKCEDSWKVSHTSLDFFDEPSEDAREITMDFTESIEKDSEKNRMEALRACSQLFHDLGIPNKFMEKGFDHPNHFEETLFDGVKFYFNKNVTMAEALDEIMEEIQELPPTQISRRLSEMVEEVSKASSFRVCDELMERSSVMAGNADIKALTWFVKVAAEERWGWLRSRVDFKDVPSNLMEVKDLRGRVLMNQRDWVRKMWESQAVWEALPQDFKTEVSKKVAEMGIYPELRDTERKMSSEAFTIARLKEVDGDSRVVMLDKMKEKFTKWVNTAKTEEERAERESSLLALSSSPPKADSKQRRI